MLRSVPNSLPTRWTLPEPIVAAPQVLVGDSLVLASGTLVDPQRLPIKFIFDSDDGPTEFLLAFEDDAERPSPRIRYEKLDENRLKLRFINIGRYRGGPQPIRWLDVGKVNKQPLMLAARIEGAIDTDDRAREVLVVHYTWLLGNAGVR